MTFIIHRRIASVLAFVLMLAACDSENNPSSMSIGPSHLSLNAPEVLTRAVDVSSLFAEVTVSYNTDSEPFVRTETASRSGPEGTWDINLSIPANTAFSLGIVWYDMEDVDRLDLTSLSRTFSTGDAGSSLTLVFNFSEYDSAGFDVDLDGFTNLQERLDGTSPFDASSPSTVIEDPSTEVTVIRFAEDSANSLVRETSEQDTTPIIEARWTSLPGNQDLNSACGSQSGFDALLAADSLAEACATADNCVLGFEQVSSAATGIEFSVIVPPLKASVGLAYALETIDSAQRSTIRRYDLCLVSINDPPVANDDSFTVIAGIPLEVTADQGVNLLSNDIDDINVSNTPLTVITTPNRAPTLATTFTLRSDGGFSYLYAPDPATATDVSLNDSFEYTITDGTNTSTATVALDLVQTDQPPVLAFEIPAQSVVVGVNADIDLSGSFEDPENSELSYSAVAGSLPPSGGLMVSEVGVLTGAAQPGDEGTYSIQIIASDQLSSATGILSLEVRANQSPIASPIPDIPGVVSGQVVSIDAGQSFSDPEGQALSFTLESSPDSGLQINQNTGLITGQLASEGVYTLTVSASDGITQPVSSSFTITQDVTTTAVLTDPIPGSLDLSALVLNSDSEVVRFSNVGNIALNYSVLNVPAWLSTDKTSGTIPAGGSDSLTITAQCGEAEETLAGSTTIESNGGAKTVSVTLDCSLEEVVAPPVDATPQEDVVGVQINDVDGRYFLGVPPSAAGSLVLDPLSSDTLTSTVITGGSTAIPISSATPFSVVYLVASDASEDAAGYFQVLLPEPVLEAIIVLTYRTELPEGGTQIVSVQVGASDGSVSNTSSVNLQTEIVGTGELQVSVSWDQESDVDLYLVEPGGEIIYWRNLESAAGGSLDLDSNPACIIDGAKNENISYGDLTPPSGVYRVEVELFSRCDIESTNYLVTIRNNGVSTTYQGVLTTDRERVVVTTFEVR